LSLNWLEINEILSEIPIEGSFLREFHQPNHHSLVFELYNRSNKFKLFISLDNRNCRLHLLEKKLSNPRTLPRFAAFLRAHLKNGKVKECSQVGAERIVKILITKGERSERSAQGEQGAPGAQSERRYLLWIRLWGGAANVIVTDINNLILDCFFRRPGKGEITGGYYNPAEELKERTAKKEYSIRPLPGPGSFNEKIEAFYFALARDQQLEELKHTIAQALQEKENRLSASIEGLAKKKDEYTAFEHYKIQGDLITTNMHTLIKGSKWLHALSFEDPEREIEIELDPTLTPAQNAEWYYEKYRKAKRGAYRIEREIDELKQSLKEIEKKRLLAVNQESPEELKMLFPIRPKQQRKHDKALSVPGLTYYSAGFRILVGRTAQENDMLLRKFVRGNDYWLHLRDYPGAYVFIKSRAGKSLPLETLLDGANLALFYSKGRKSGSGDVYYTKAKYLRRVKRGRTGLIIPTQEKNLFVKLDQARLERLKDSDLTY
jgi:predicted ribosome quality control (RQC) complex YloA/Tae2 family protein